MPNTGQCAMSPRSFCKKGACRSRLAGASGIDHELQEVPVRISHVNAGARFLAAALTRYRSFDNLRLRSIQHRLERFRRTVPDNAQVAARRLCGGGSQRERWVLPMRGTMKVDHLVADINRTGGLALAHLETEAAIEGQH